MFVLNVLRAGLEPVTQLWVEDVDLIFLTSKAKNKFLNVLFFVLHVSLYIYFWLCWVFVAVCGFPLVMVSGEPLPAVARGLLIVVASLDLVFGSYSMLLWPVHLELWLMGLRGGAQQLWHTSPVAPWHVGSSQTRDWTRVPCIGRQTLKRWTTTEVPLHIYFLNRKFFLFLFFITVFMFETFPQISGDLGNLLILNGNTMQGCLKL